MGLLRQIGILACVLATIAITIAVMGSVKFAAASVVSNGGVFAGLLLLAAMLAAGFLIDRRENKPRREISAQGPKESELPIIDAEFTVITPARQPPPKKQNLGTALIVLLVVSCVTMIGLLAFNTNSGNTQLLGSRQSISGNSLTPETVEFLRNYGKTVK